MKVAIAVEGLSVALPAGADRELAVENLSLELRANEILCVVGESGSGKSMVASAILGLLPESVRATAGSILMGDKDLLKLPDEELRKIRGARIGMIFQEPMTALNPLTRIGDQIGEMFRTHTTLSPSEIRSRVFTLLHDVQIPDPEGASRAYPHQLSGGQRQRAMIAMALALEPDVLIADEPTTALDVTTQAQILKLIRELQQRKGTAVLFVTHDFGVVSEIADRIVVMQHGKLVEQGYAKDILDKPRHVYTRALISAVPALKPPMAKTILGDAILQIDNVSKTYRSGGFLSSGRRTVRAVADVSLQLPKGGTLGIVGESGSGKSTLARCIVRLLESDSGSIHLGDVDLLKLSRGDMRQATRRIQMVFQDPFSSLNPRRKVGDLIAQGPIVHGAGRSEAYAKARELIDLVGLDSSAFNRYPHEFSGGQRQRIGLARALALEPEVLVADEPVSALDVSVQAQVLQLLSDLRERLGLSMVFITHDLRVAAQLCDRIAVMKNGEVVEEGLTAEVFDSPRHSYTRALFAAVPGKDWTPPVDPIPLRRVAPAQPVTLNMSPLTDVA